MKGYIAPQIFTLGYIDEETGLPVPDQIGWGKDYECNYYPNTHNNKGVNAGGQFQLSEYEITVHDMSFHANIVQLKNRKGNVIATGEVKSIMELEAVQRIKIVL